MSEYFVEGWTEPVDYQLKKGPKGGPVAAFNASGMTVALELRDRDGVVVSEAGATDWLDATQSTVRYIPNAADLTYARSPMKARWKVTSGSGISWYPRSEPEEWIVGRP
jgi:hypothetical protein